jgi:hypothetical protein
MTFSVWRRFLLELAAAGMCVAQGLCSLPTQARGFAPPPSADAYTVLDTIGKVVPFQTRTIRLFPSSSALVKERGGAAAQLCGDNSAERWIFYDPVYIDAVKPIGGKSDLPRYFVLAHEAAHHINGDTLLGNDWSKDQELAADYSAAVWLTRLGVNREQLLRTFDALEFPVESVNGYPRRAERRARVIQGYDDTRFRPILDQQAQQEHAVKIVANVLSSVQLDFYNERGTRFVSRYDNISSQGCRLNFTYISSTISKNGDKRTNSEAIEISFNQVAVSMEDNLVVVKNVRGRFDGVVGGILASRPIDQHYQYTFELHSPFDPPSQQDVRFLRLLSQAHDLCKPQ